MLSATVIAFYDTLG